MATIHYRLCSRLFPTITTDTLYEALAQTMLSPSSNGEALIRNVGERHQTCDDAHKVVLNHYRRSRRFVFAEILRVEPDAHVVTVRQNAQSNESLEVAQFRAPDGHTPLRGAIYMLVSEDHLLFTSRGDLSSRRLEDYLTWLLQKVPAILPADRKLILETRTPRRDNIPAKKVQLSLNPLDWMDHLAREPDQRGVERRTSASESVLQTLAVSDADLGRMIGDGQVEVDIVLKFKEGRKSRFYDVGTLDNIFRNAPDVETMTYEGPHGPVSPLGNRLQGKRNIQSDGTLLDANDARDKLAAQFAEWMEQGHIVANARAQDER